ncbi:hypothetical protein [Micromonospora chersina]
MTSSTMSQARAFWVRAPGRGEIRPVVLPNPGAGDVLVRTRYSAVSRGMLARAVADRLADRVLAGELDVGALGLTAIRVTLRKSHVASASYERLLHGRQRRDEH